MSVTMLGIAGPSGSGKSSVARAIVDKLGAAAVTLVPLDAYYHDLERLAPALRREMNFDSPDAIDLALLTRQLRGLARGQAIELPAYRFETHSREPRGKLVAPASTVIVEGLFALYWAEICRLFALKVFVDVEDPVALERRIERDVRERGRTPGAVRAQYEATVRPMYERHVLPTRARADLVLDGRRAAEELVSELLARWPARAVRE